MHFDLLNSRSEEGADRVLIITPYVEERFFHQLILRLKPSKLFIILDAGCRRQDVDTCRNACKGVKKLEIAVAQSPRLSHIKFFYIEETPNIRIKRRFIAGSANATYPAFSLENAELLISGEVKKDSIITKWAEEVMSFFDTKIEEVDVEPRIDDANGFTITLPALKLKPLRAGVSDFDVWIQKGSLLRSYQADSSIFRFQVPLLKPLPPGEVVRKIRLSGFAPDEISRLSKTYISVEGLDGRSSRAAPKWRSNYFIPTQYADWCSEACMQKHRKDFVGNRARERQGNIDRLLRLSDLDQAEVVVSELVASMNQLWLTLASDAKDYLVGDKRLSDEYYADLARVKIENDLNKALDDEYVRRYVSGFEIAPLPMFREDLPNWEAMIKSWASSIISICRTRSKIQSKLVSAIKSAAESRGFDPKTSEPPELVGWLRENFADGDIRSRMMGYYKQ